MQQLVAEWRDVVRRKLKGLAQASQAAGAPGRAVVPIGDQRAEGLFDLALDRNHAVTAPELHQQQQVGLAGAARRSQIDFSLEESLDQLRAAKRRVTIQDRSDSLRNIIGGYPAVGELIR